MDTSLPPIHRVDMRSHPDYKQVPQTDGVKSANFALSMSPKCKYKLPCGRCELTKELCTYD